MNSMGVWDIGTLNCGGTYCSYYYSKEPVTNALLTQIESCHSILMCSVEMFVCSLIALALF